MRMPTTPPPPAITATVEEVEVAMEEIVIRATPDAPSRAGPSVEEVVMVLDEDAEPPPASERHGAVVVLVLESAQVPAVTSHLLAVEVPVPPPMMGVRGPPPTAEVAESSSTQVSLTVEEMMDLETSRYFDLLGVRVIDLEAPQLPEKEYDVAAAERRSNEPTIMDTIASVSKALQEYECAGGFAPATTEDTEDVTPAAPVARVELKEDTTVPPHADEGREASPPRPVDAAVTPAPIAKPISTEAVAGGEDTSPPGPVTIEVEDVGARTLDEPATVGQGLVVPETVARATTPEIQEAEETKASLSRGAAGDDAWTLELACSSWVTTTGLDADSEDNEEAAAHHTLERGMTWVRRAFDELILPATSVSFLVKGSFLILRSSRASPVVPVPSVVDARVFRSEACSRGAATPCGADPAGDAACRGSGRGSRHCSE
jgi:hypothetical protein